LPGEIRPGHIQGQAPQNGTLATPGRPQQHKGQVPLHGLSHIRQRGAFEPPLGSGANPASFGELEGKRQVFETHPPSQRNIVLVCCHLLLWPCGALRHQPGGIGTATHANRGIARTGQQMQCLQQIGREQQGGLLTSHHFQILTGRETQAAIGLGQDPGQLIQPLHNHVERQIGVLSNLPRVDGVGNDITPGADRA
jgi:hypothetical protein